MTRPTCGLTGCGRPHHGRGYCRPHYVRWQRRGDPCPDVPVRRRTPGGASLWSAHARVRSVRGPASGQHCADCGGAAAVWSYDGTDPAERTDPARGRSYSLDPTRYRARCRSCHRRTVNSGARPSVLPEPDVERAARLYRAGASAGGIAALLAAPRVAVLRALRAHGVAIRPPGPRRRAPADERTDRSQPRRQATQPRQP